MAWPCLRSQTLRATLLAVAITLSVAALAAGFRAANADPIAALLQDEERLLEAAAKYFPAEETKVPGKRIFRLTRDQIDATVSAVLPGYATASVKTVMAKDPLQTNYEYAELLSFNGANHAALQGWIGEIAGRVRAKPAGVIDCPDRAAADCLREQARRFVVRALRADVSEERIERVVAFFLDGVRSGGLAQAAGDLVEVVLNSPDFLFRKEVDVDRNQRLAPAQLLQALSYVIADSPPDRLKLDASQAGRLLRRADDAHTLIQSLVASSEAREKLLRFFKTWLEVKDPADYTISSAVFPEFTPKLAGAMVEETTAFLRAKLMESNPRLSDITQGAQQASPALAAIYGAPTAAGTGAGGAAKASSLDPAQRFGIFSQPAVLASHSGPTTSRPIKRGVFWVRKVMCMELEPPPQGIDSSLPEGTHFTERERIEKATAKKACIGCHRVIDPFGFFLESYDALGRWRSIENGHPIDTAVELDFLDEGTASTAGPVQALQALTSSLMFKQCFVRQLFRYYMGRSEEPSDDPLLRRMFLDLVRDDNLLGLIETLAWSDSVGRRQ